MLAAFDIALAAGVAWGGPENGSPQTDLWELPKGEHNLDRALSIVGDCTGNLVRNRGIKIVAVEAVMLKTGRQHSAYSLFLLASLGAVVRYAAERNGASVMPPVDVRTWRKTVLGQGNLVTEEAVAAIFKRCDQLGWDHKEDHNVAEACGLWYHSMALRFPKWRPGKRKS